MNLILTFFYQNFRVIGLVAKLRIAYLSSSKKSISFKKDLLKKAKNFSKQIPDLLDKLNINEDDEEKPSKIKKQITKFKKIIPSNPDDKPEPKPKPTATTKIAKTVKTTSKKAKRFFTKAGKMLRK